MKIKFFVLTVLLAFAAIVCAGNFSSLTVGISNSAANGGAAIGEANTSLGWGSMAVGHATYASGTISFSGGQYSYATGIRSFAFGNDTYANGSDSAALGAATSAMGARSFAFGFLTMAEGDASTAGGRSTRAYHHQSFVVGQFNDPLLSISDRGHISRPLFVVGNGTSVANRSNALEVRANGEVHIQKIPPKGGISMGNFQ